jgi:hypothetical protein
MSYFTIAINIVICGALIFIVAVTLFKWFEKLLAPRREHDPKTHPGAGDPPLGPHLKTPYQNTRPKSPPEATGRISRMVH